MPEIKEVFQGVLVKSLNLPEAEVSSLFTDDGQLKDDAETIILNRHAESVQKAREKAKSDREEQYKRGLREKGSEYEKLLKEAGVEIGDAMGADAVKKLKEHIEAQVKPSDLDDDKVKNSAFFRKREKELNDLLAAKEAEHTKAWSERDAKEQRDRTMSTVKSKASEIVQALKPVLPADATKAKNQLRLMDLEIEAMSYDVDEDGTITIKDKDGKRIEGANGSPIMFDAWIKSNAEKYFDFQVSEKKGSGGDPTNGTAKGPIKLQKPATRQDLAKQIYEINENASLKPEEKQKLVEELKALSPELS